jgi:hypothetical protein
MLLRDRDHGDIDRGADATHGLDHFTSLPIEHVPRPPGFSPDVQRAGLVAKLIHRGQQLDERAPLLGSAFASTCQVPA